jgi:NADPH:quinone reductase-like Zn-dependent oxidoreductase
MEQLIAWYDEALFRPVIDRTFRFSQAAEAHHYIQDRKNRGKVLLIP